MNIALWIIQVLLALLFLFAGGMKLIIPPDVLASMGSPNQVHLPGLLVQLIGVFEVLGSSKDASINKLPQITQITRTGKSERKPTTSSDDLLVLRPSFLPIS